MVFLPTARLQKDNNCRCDSQQCFIFVRARPPFVNYCWPSDRLEEKSLAGTDISEFVDARVFADELPKIVIAQNKCLLLPSRLTKEMSSVNKACIEGDGK